MNSALIGEMNIYYQKLKQLKQSGIILEVWGDGFQTEYEGILGELYEFLCENYDRIKNDWVDIYMQIYSWEYCSFHEGVDTYYTNFYGNSDYITLLKIAEYLQTHGFHEINEIYMKGIHDYSQFEYSQYPQKWILQTKEIDNWIRENTEPIYHVMLSILINNIKKWLFQNR